MRCSGHQLCLYIWYGITIFLYSIMVVPCQKYKLECNNLFSFNFKISSCFVLGETMEIEDESESQAELLAEFERRRRVGICFSYIVLKMFVVRSFIN